jgi:hypothetical protein
VPSLAETAVDWLNIQSCYTSSFVYEDSFEALDNSQNNPILASEDVGATNFFLLSINAHKPPLHVKPSDGHKQHECDVHDKARRFRLYYTDIEGTMLSLFRRHERRVHFSTISPHPIHKPPHTKSSAAIPYNSKAGLETKTEWNKVALDSVARRQYYLARK